MRSRERQRQKRKDLTWCLLGVVLVQGLLVMYVEGCGVTVRDPQYANVEHILRERQAEAPGRPLVVALGSSFTAFAFRTDQLNNPANDADPVVVNGALFGCGTIMQQVVLRRILHAGIRPDLLVVEAAPLVLGPLDEDVFDGRRINPIRLTAAELLRVCSYAEKPHRFWRGWLKGRALPSENCPADFRDALGIDLPVDARARSSARGLYGWCIPPTTLSRQEIQAKMQNWLQIYASALTQPGPPGALRSLRDTLDLCRLQRIPVVLLAPPQSSAFRSYCPPVEEARMNAIRGLAHEFAAPLIDARAWLDDDSFYDGLHTFRHGADQFTERFGREAIALHLPHGQPGAGRAVTYQGR